jgi:hypothetical protein
VLVQKKEPHDEIVEHESALNLGMCASAWASPAITRMTIV